MLTFDVYLRESGLNLKKIRLVRHQDTRKSASCTPYELWRQDTQKFELYQRIQQRDVFDGLDAIASFAVTPFNECLFIGLYAVEGKTVAPSGLIDPISAEDVGGRNMYSLVRRAELSEYIGRLIIKWGSGFRAWIQLAEGSEKEVIEIRRSDYDPPFPGFMQFKSSFSALPNLPQRWQETLSAVAGVYLLTHTDGRYYVGSAQGEQGFWGRWSNYVATGHGGNVKMKELPECDYQVAILEVCSTSASEEEILESEKLWKLKLSTRQFGLNAN